LRQIPDHHPRTGLSLDEVAEPDFDGIAHRDLVGFLLAPD
jgi:hypothetical protein